MNYIFLMAGAAFLSTLLGGLFALRLKDRLHLILGFSAGAIVAVTFFDLLPEAVGLSGGAFPVQDIFTLTACGFLLYLLIDRLILSESHSLNGHSARPGHFGAGSLSVHSFLDGLGIGLAFQVSTGVGAIVTAAVLTHDFSDGINTVNLVLKGGGNTKAAFKWLLTDALAPVLGVFATLFFKVSSVTLGLLLAVFAGFFLYIGASDLIPESYHAHPVRWTTLMTVLGVVVLYLAIKLAGV